MRISKHLAVALVAPLTVVYLAAAPEEDPKATEVLKAARAALGGEDALGKVQSLSASGDHRRVLGERESSGEVSVDVIFPDKLRRTESFGFGGGPTMERVSVLNGNEVWDDATNRGGGGGFMRFGGTGGPGGPGREPTDGDRQRFREMQQRRMKGELARLGVGWLLRADAPVTYVATAEAEDGSKADVLEFKPGGGAAIRLFVDQATHLPMMLTYEGPMPRMMTRRPGQRPTPEEIEKMRQEPPQMATFEVRFAEHKKVDGVLLPHVITTGANGNITEEWTIETFKINPSLKPESFVKKGS